jgi:hypothetical protein
LAIRSSDTQHYEDSVIVRVEQGEVDEGDTRYADELSDLVGELSSFGEKAMKKTSPLIFKIFVIHSIKNVIRLIAISAMLVFATNARAERGVLEWDTDRPGSDIANFGLPGGNPFLCQELCLGAPGCLAWTYVVATGVF